MSARAELVHQLQCEGANTERAAEEIADAHRAETLTEGIDAITKWVPSNKRLTPGLHLAIGVLMSIRDDLSPAGTSTATEDYPGQLAMLTGLVATLHAVAAHGDLADVQKLLAEFKRDEQDAHAEAGAR